MFGHMRISGYKKFSIQKNVQTKNNINIHILEFP